MKILIIGSGGREHAIAWKVKQSLQVTDLYCAPGNGGMAQIAECVSISADDIMGLIRFAQDKQIDLTIVGPEAPLVAGIVDAFEKAELKVFGPSKAAAQLEGSKVFSKEFMKRWSVPTAEFSCFDNLDNAQDYIAESTFPLVIKADGLAAGKGVIICEDLEQAQEALHQIMEEKVFKEAGNKVLIEECLVGEEASILAISDGENFVVLESSQDHKRIFDDDQGPNTGGMGAYSPAPVITDALHKQIVEKIIGPMIHGMKEESMPFKGVLYAGIMVTSEGPMTLEFNVRFGDPETQAVLPRLKSDLADIMLASVEGRLNDIELEWDRRACVSVVISSGGYPGDYEKGFPITGLEEAVKEDAIVFHAGTELNGDQIVTSGGRVLGVTSLGNSIADAIENAYEAVDKISFERCFFRRDIGQKALRKSRV